jgi:hypothetical protein
VVGLGSALHADSLLRDGQKGRRSDHPQANRQAIKYGVLRIPCAHLAPSAKPSFGRMERVVP